MLKRDSLNTRSHKNDVRKARFWGQNTLMFDARRDLIANSGARRKFWVCMVQSAREALKWPSQWLKMMSKIRAFGAKHPKFKSAPRDYERAKKMLGFL